MRKVLFFVLIGVICMNAYAQKGDKSIGVNLGYGTEIKSIAIGAKFNYNISDPIRLSPSFNYFLKKDGLSEWEINTDLHYLFPIAENFTIYPLAGLTLTGWKMSGNSDFDDFLNEWGEYLDEDDYNGDSSTTTKFGVNLGGGIGYQLTNRIGIGAEIKYSLISDFDQLVLSANVNYKF